MNKQQKDYALATARLKAVESALDEAEAKFMATQAVTDPEDGAPAERIYHVTWDDALFERLNTSFEEEHKALCEEFSAASVAKKAAEDALIEFGLSIAPASVRETLAEGVKHIAHIREKFIDATFRLDTKTI